MSGAAYNALPIVNDRISDEILKEVERVIVRKGIELVDSEEEAILIFRELFPGISEDEIREFYRLKAE